MINWRHQELAEEVANLVIEEFPNAKIEKIHEGLEEDSIWIRVRKNGYETWDIIEAVSEKCRNILLEYGCDIAIIPV